MAQDILRCLEKSMTVVHSENELSTRVFSMPRFTRKNVILWQKVEDFSLIQASCTFESSREGEGF